MRVFLYLFQLLYNHIDWCRISQNNSFSDRIVDDRIFFYIISEAFVIPIIYLKIGTRTNYDYALNIKSMIK